MSVEHAWVRRLARARRLGGLAASEFWRLTPAEVDGICRDGIEDLLDLDRRNDWRVADIMSLLANCHRDPKKSRPFKPTDFIRGGNSEPSEEELEDKLKAIFGTL